MWYGQSCCSIVNDDLQLTSTVGTRRQLRSADSPTLVVMSTRCSTLGDRAFPMAAARAWNSLPPAVRDAPSLLSFRSRLKTWLFELTLAWHWLHSPAALHFVCDFSNSVKCPCNVSHESVTLIFTFLVIIIIIKLAPFFMAHSLYQVTHAHCAPHCINCYRDKCPSHSWISSILTPNFRIPLLNFV